MLPNIFVSLHSKLKYELDRLYHYRFIVNIYRMDYYMDSYQNAFSSKKAHQNIGPYYPGDFSKKPTVDCRKAGAGGWQRTIEF